MEYFSFSKLVFQKFLMKKKIIIYSNNYWNLYNFRINLINYFIKKNFEVILVGQGDRYLSKFENLNIKCFELNLNKSNFNILHNFLFFYKFYFILKKIKPQYILSFTIKPNIFSGIVCRFQRIKHIATVTGLGSSLLSDNLITRSFIKFLYRCALINSNIVFHNKFDLTFFEKKILFKSNNLYLVGGSGIDFNKFNINKYDKMNYNSQNNFLMISRLIFHKGVYEYYQAAKYIKKKFPHITFSLLGPIDENNPSSISKQQILKWHKSKVINYLGYKSDVIPFILRSSCIILPSYREGLSKVLLESCALKKPIITTNVPGCNELVIDGENGYLCYPKDVKSLCKAIEKFISLSIRKREKMGNFSREIVELKYDENIIFKKYYQLLT